MVVARRGIGVVIGIIGEILAFITLIIILFMYVHARFPFLPAKAIQTVALVREVAIIAVIGLFGLRFALKKSWTLTFIFIGLLVLVISFMFLPGALPSWAT